MRSWREGPGVRRWAPTVAMVAAMTLTACVASSEGSPVATSPGDDSSAATVATPAGDDVVVAAAGLGLAEGWENYGWAATVTDDDVTLDLGGWGGWIVADLELAGTFSELRIALEPLDGADDLGDEFLRVSVADSIGSDFPVLVPTFDLDDGVLHATVAVEDLLGGAGSFDRIVLAANTDLPAPTRVVVRELALVPGVFEPFDGDVVERTAAVHCDQETRPISPYIYGVARPLFPDDAQWTIGATARRWGGNPTSRYNWRIGAWNTVFDYYFQNVQIGFERPGHEEFLLENWEHGLESAVTVSMLDWVAKDTTSASFPVSVVGEQEYVDPDRPDFGNGRTPSGDEIEPPDPSATSVPHGPDDVAAWITAMRELAAAEGGRDPFMYILDNEPMLWNSTHRDVVTEPLGYDELLERSVATAEAVRQAAPDALIAGPAVWGWPAYFYSAIDAVGGFSDVPDHRAHGNVGLVEWYLQQMAEYEDRTGVRLLDVLDVHFYPQDGSYGGAIDERAAARRLRTTRSLWDPNYGEETWIEETVELIPRMQDWVDENYPGTLLSIGEYSFGAENHISGGLAQAEALGRFGQNGLFSAFYWVTPPDQSPVHWAFRAFRDYDGAGSGFGDVSIPTSSKRPLSVFASTFAGAATDPDLDRDVIVTVNLSPDEGTAAAIELAGCDRTVSNAVQYTQSSAGFVPIDSSVTDGVLAVEVPPYSITVIELR